MTRYEVRLRPMSFEPNFKVTEFFIIIYSWLMHATVVYNVHNITCILGIKCLDHAPNSTFGGTL